MKKLPVQNGLITFDINWEAMTAGPSPDNNKRVEVFLFGCYKAAKGDPCPGCFNSKLWDSSVAEFSKDPIECADKINELAPNKYVTIGGGEPTDQIDALIPFAKRLKEHGFHILMYTWRDLLKARKGYIGKDMSDNNNKYPIDTNKVLELLKYLDIVVDGEFNPEEKLYCDDCTDGFYGSIGSGNQKIWDVHNMDYRYMRDIRGITLGDNNNLIFLEKEKEI